MTIHLIMGNLGLMLWVMAQQRLPGGGGSLRFAAILLPTGLLRPQRGKIATMGRQNPILTISG
ncbi:hypothetical protein [Ollibium composti]|uniref:Uncharacterized protein n=1 Tax=Ollibium composti TaxID=2675109 RepID=A0ABY2Q7I8_9HYPH|nr:hypothetical protein [Mesorhizobium composti]THF57142.1 hypothetical protein E6C48_12560 [Mesorhizobium composti]